MKTKVLAFLLLLSSYITAQDINKNFERWQPSNKRINITGMSLSPDGKTVAISCGKNNPLMIYDLASKKIVQEIDVQSKYMGYNVHYSTGGSYLLLQEKVFETSFKKAKKADYDVVDLKSGKLIHRFNKISDAKISPDEKEVITLENGTVYFRDLLTGNVNKKFSPEDACNALAISPNGQDLAVVKKPTKSDVKMLVSKNVDKKRIKAAAKAKHLITVYDANSLELKTLIPEFYDNINLLSYSKLGDKLLSFNVAANSYINVALPNQDYEPIREAYLSRTTMQPEYGYSKNQEYFAIATVEVFPSLNVYDVESGSMLDTYNTKMKIWKNAKEGIYAGSNTSFVFLPDNKHILMGYGNSLIQWKFKK